MINFTETAETSSKYRKSFMWAKGYVINDMNKDRKINCILSFTSTIGKSIVEWKYSCMFPEFSTGLYTQEILCFWVILVYDRHNHIDQHLRIVVL